LFPLSLQEMNPQFLLTADGSHTLYLKELDETYHSRNGALQESLHIFIGAGLHEILKTKQRIRIMEIGFGTGLNAILTFMETLKLNFKCSYCAVEATPLPFSLINELNYLDWMDEETKRIFKMLHACESGQTVELSGGMEFCCHHFKLEDFNCSPPGFDLVYFDAFAPEKQPEMWTEEVFKKIYDCMNDGGMLVTYSSKGDVKRTLRKVGFEVKRLEGPPGKKHIVRAVKN